MLCIAKQSFFLPVCLHDFFSTFVLPVCLRDPESTPRNRVTHRHVPNCSWSIREDGAHAMQSQTLMKLMLFAIVSFSFSFQSWKLVLEEFLLSNSRLAAEFQKDPFYHYMKMLTASSQILKVFCQYFLPFRAAGFTYFHFGTPFSDWFVQKATGSSSS